MLKSTICVVAFSLSPPCFRHRPRRTSEPLHLLCKRIVSKVVAGSRFGLWRSVPRIESFRVNGRIGTCILFSRKHVKAESLVVFCNTVVGFEECCKATTKHQPEKCTHTLIQYAWSKLATRIVMGFRQECEQRDLSFSSARSTHSPWNKKGVLPLSC